MQTNLHNTTINSVRRLSHNSLAFLALAVGTGLIVGALAFSLLSGQPASASAAATANTTVPAVSLAHERAEEHQWLAQRNAVTPAQQPSTAMTPIHSTMREQDERLERLLQEPYLAELAQSTSATCNAECFSLLWQQMWDLAEQVRRGW